MTSLFDIAVSDGNALPPSINTYDAEREEALARRYTRAKEPDLVFEFTRDPGLLHQYYQIRMNEYNAVYGKFFGINDKYFTDGEGEYDRTGHILIVRRGNFCVGGARINIRSPRKTTPLPVETEDFKLEEQFPELSHKQMTYCQVSGFSLLPEFRGGTVTFFALKRIFAKSAALNVDVLFVDVSPMHARLYHCCCIAMGLTRTKIHYDIATPDVDMHRIICSVGIDKSMAEGSSHLSAIDDVHAEADKLIFNNPIIQAYNPAEALFV